MINLRFWRLTGLLVTVGGTQAIIQIIGTLSGLLVLRLLTSEQYSLYTIAYTMLGTMTVLADGGIANGVMAEGGKVWNDKRKLGVVLATAWSLRTRLASISLIAFLPALYYLLHKHGASPLEILAMIGALTPLFFIQLSQAILSAPPKLHQRLREIQQIDVVTAALRLALMMGAMALLPCAFVALACAAATQSWGNWRLRRISSTLIDDSRDIDPGVRAAIYGIARRSFPNRLYFALSGQLSLWLLSLFGTTTAIAEAGALGRLSQLFMVFSLVYNLVSVPRFARSKPEKRPLLLLITPAIGSAVLIGSLCIFTAWQQPDALLAVLGSNYGHLEHELLLSVTIAATILVNGICIKHANSRGWIIHPLLNIPLNLLTVAVALYIYDVSTVLGVLRLNLLVGAVQLTTTLGHLLIHLHRQPSSSLQ